MCIIVVGIFITRNVLKHIIPIINAQCLNQAKNMAIIISNKQATKIMNDFKYEDLAEIIKTEDGKIQMIKLNVIPANEIITAVTDEIQNELNSNDNIQVSIRLGSIFGIKFFSGIGPKINVRLWMNGNTEASLKSEFKTAGINQTLHQIFLEIKCNIIIYSQYDTISEVVTNKILIAESIIVGEIPKGYYSSSGYSMQRNTE